MRRSGRSRPSSCRIGRLSQGSMRGAGGQTPSTSPPRMMRSDSVRRASSWPIDVRAAAGQFRPPHQAIAKGGLKYIGVVAELDHEPDLLCSASKSSNAEASTEPCWPSKMRDNAVLVAGEIDQRFAVALRQLGEVKRF